METVSGNINTFSGENYEDYIFNTIYKSMMDVFRLWQLCCTQWYNLHLLK